MSKIPFTPPKFHESSFNCPNCLAYAHQMWSQALTSGHRAIDDLFVSYCSNCTHYAVWKEEEIISPFSTSVEPPNTDLGEDIKKDYIEASSILPHSPRGAAALLRLAIQKICNELGDSKKDINENIKTLVAEGLPSRVQKALDIVRVTGNDAVHPGQIDLRDKPEIALQLFKLVNIIAEKLITEPKEIDDIFEALPESKKDQIKQRDSVSKLE